MTRSNHQVSDEHFSSKLFINGQTVEAISNERMETINPATGHAFGSLSIGGVEDVDQAVSAAKAALKGPWRSLSPKERGQCLFNIAEGIRARKNDFSVLECLDTGKPISTALNDVNRAADFFTYYGGMCDKLHGETIPRGLDKITYTQLEPVGVTGHITPWNVPLSTAARGLAPALACGNTAVIKPAEDTSLTTVLLAQIMIDAGLPAGVCNVVTGLGSVVGAALSQHRDVDHLTFTGSVATGKAVMRAASDHVAGVTLELGGKSPMIALADADIDQVVTDALKQLTHNAGQICSSGTRLVIHRSIQEQVLDKLVAKAKDISIGSGLDDPEMGPLISSKQRGDVERFVASARSRNLDVITGGQRAIVEGYEDGFYYQPTVINNVPVDDELAQCEIFGPVLCVQAVDDDAEAISVANSTSFGLAAGIYTRDISKALRLARDVVAGQVYINEYHSAGDTVPFGGFGDSGIGREKGLAALANYTAAKAITIKVD